MAGLEPHAVPQIADDPLTASRNARLGMRLFVAYSALYAGYVLLVAFFGDVMRWTPWPGINLAVIYGLTLIISAFALALLYSWLCRRPVTDPSSHSLPTNKESR